MGVRERSRAGIGTVLLAAVLAGLLAGMVAAALHAVASEPLIDRAIALEDQAAHATSGEHEPVVVGRDVQRLGLWLGWGFIGLMWALLFALVYHLAERFLPGRTPLRRGLVLALLAYGVVGLLPALKYPANPPGVGDPATIQDRQFLYLALLGLGLLGAALAVAVGRARGDWRLTGVVAVAVGVVLLVVLPNNTDPVLVPAELLTPFRALSLAGWTLFWAVFGAAFALLLRRLAAPAGAPRRLATSAT